MKKMYFILVVLIGMFFSSFMSTTGISQKSNSNEFAIETPTDICYTVSVCKITSVGTGSMSSKNCSFSGEYDSSDNYIVIYDKNGNKVASGTPSYNRNQAGSRSNYSYCLHDTYYFNL